MSVSKDVEESKRKENEKRSLNFSERISHKSKWFCNMKMKEIKMQRILKEVIR